MSEEKLKKLVDVLNDFPRKQSTLLIGIDGCGGAGKSTFANKLKERFENATVVHMDDFYFPSASIIKDHPLNKPIGADCDWKRVLQQVLEPISQEKEGHYQRYDWESDQLAEWHTVPIGGIVIVEGVYSTRKELSDVYDFKIWLETPRDIRLNRGLERDGEEARDRWENNWMIAEDCYSKEHTPKERANLIVDGTQ
ncbi:uridine kinase family protein [Peribacillus acanthi]|uniref:uridine kinase family protein n=1 Tax=Peribacillus acanthi TaxID=2171554 RepID=UPI000D3E1E3F|nr:AAA family ATPase [Peribacillus acanthi]